MGILFYIPVYAIAVALVFLTLGVTEAGYRIGLRANAHDERVDGAVGVVQNSVLGLMAFLLGLSFSFTAGRFETGHDLEQKEANALGTLYSRTELIDDPRGTQIRALLPQYVEARIDVYLAGLVDDAAVAKARARSDELASRMWKLDADLFRQDKRDLRVSLMTQTMNEVFDAGGDVEEARRHRVPDVMFYLLFFSVLFSGGFVGYGFGRTGRRVLPAWILFASLTAVTTMVILDLERPERGLIRNNHTPLRIVLQSMK